MKNYTPLGGLGTTAHPPPSSSPMYAYRHRGVVQVVAPASKHAHTNSTDGFPPLLSLCKGRGELVSTCQGGKTTLVR